ncbi:uncharacterized protein LOC122174587 [Chrysemys picta bellii]|uniref:uncharacterized protein LOC122174587 n=1 Tax=Chrysemys picta bellii TaxID=8478 RepID=UPI0032B22235
MERPSGAAQSAGSLKPREPSPTGPPASNQAMLETLPILPSYPSPISDTPWTLDHPSTGGLSSITVPVRLDALSYLLNSALLGACMARTQTPLSGGQGPLATGHGGPTPLALGSRCHPHYCCSPQPACANPQQPNGARQAWVGCCGGGAMGQSSTSCSQEASRGHADGQNCSPRWDQRGSASPRGWGENRRAGGQKDFNRPWGGGKPRGEVDSAPWKAGLGGSRNGPGRAQDSGYAPRKRNQDGRPWGTPESKRWSSGWPQRRGSGAEETESAKAAREDWEEDYKGSAAQGSVLEEATSSQPNLPASQGGEDWEKEYEKSREPPKSAPAVPPLPEVASKAQTASLQEKTTPLPPSKDSSFSSYLENLFTDLPRESSTVSDPCQEREPHGDAAESGTRPPEGGGQCGQVSAKLGDFTARSVDPACSAVENDRS